MSNCTPLGGPAQTTSTEVSAFGDPRARVFAGPMGPYPIDIRVAPQTEADETNDTVRLLVKLSDGTEFTGEPFAKSSIPAGTTPQQFVNMIAWKELLEDFRKLKDSIPASPDLSQYVLQSQMPTLTGLVTYDDMEQAVKTMVQNAMETVEIGVSNEQVQKIVDSMGVALKTDIPAQQDLSGYALKTDVVTPADLAPYAKKTDIPAQQDLSPYALKSSLPDFSTFALKSDIPATLDLSGYALKSQLPDLSPYALKSQLPDLSPYALKSQIPAEPDLSPYALKTDIPAIPDLSPYALKTQLPDFTTFALKNQLPDFTTYALKSQLPDFSTFALTTQLPDFTTFARKTDLPTQQVTQNTQAITALQQTAITSTQAKAIADKEILAALPIGSLMWWPGTTAPAGWKIRDGSTFSTTANPQLAVFYPNGQLPDDRGLFIRGYDPQGNYDANGQGRAVGSYEEGSYLCRASDTAVVNFDGYQTFSQLNWDAPDRAKGNNYDFNTLSYGGGTFGPATDPNATTYLWKYIGVARPKNRSYLPIIYVGASN